MIKKENSLLKELRGKLHDNKSDDHFLSRSFEGFLIDFHESNKFTCFQIIGEPGIGKTHSMVKLYDGVGLGKTKTFVNKDTLNIIEKQEYIFIDGINEFSEQELKSLKKIIQLNTSSKFITSSWNVVDIGKKSSHFFMESNVNLAAMLKHYNISDFTDEADKHLLNTLNYRQICTLLSEMDNSYKAKNLWDKMQKIYENIILKSKISVGSEKNSWQYFKKVCVLENSDFPYLQQDTISKDDEYKLIKYGVLQNNEYGLFINNIEFLISIKLRKYSSDNSDLWVDDFIKKNSHSVIPILIWYFLARKNEGNLAYVLNNYEVEGSRISEKLFMYEFKDKPRIKWDKIIFDRLHVFFDILPHITEKKAIKLFMNNETLNYKVSQSFPGDSSKKYSRSDNLTQFKKLLIASTMRMQTGANDKENEQISRLINYEKMKRINCEKRYKIPVKRKGKSIFKGLLLSSYLVKLGCKISNERNVIKIARKKFFLKTESINYSEDIKKFEAKINKWFYRIFDKHANSVQNDFDRLFYMTDKDIVLEGISSDLCKLNDSYECDKYTSKILKPFISYAFLHHDGLDIIDVFDKMSKRECRDLDHAFSAYRRDKRVSRVIPRFLDYITTGNTFSHTYEAEAPYLKIFDDMYDEDVSKLIEKIATIINKPKFLDHIEILEIINKIKIKKEGATYWPIFLAIRREKAGYYNTFITGNNVKSIMEWKTDFDQFWWGGKFPKIPTKIDWQFDENDFIVFNDSSTNDRAIFTKNNELLGRYYEFYGDSTNRSMHGSDYRDDQIMIRHIDGCHLSKKEYDLKYRKFGDDEFERFLTKEEKEIYSQLAEEKYL